jgi:hypothetical protein
METRIVAFPRYLFRPSSADQFVDYEGFSGVRVRFHHDGVDLHVSHGLYAHVPRQEIHQVDAIDAKILSKPLDVGVESIQCYSFRDTYFLCDVCLHQVQQEFGQTLLFFVPIISALTTRNIFWM